MSQTRKPPAYLKRDGRAWFKAIAQEYVLTSAAEWELLGQAAAILDRLRECAAQIAKDGLTVATAAGGLKPHPCANLERDCKTLFARLCRELRLHDPADDDDARPPRIPNRR